MKPAPTQVLEVLALGLMADIAAHVDDDYQHATLQISAALLLGAREEFDRAAARRVDENCALRELFAAARPVVEDEPLQARLAHAAATVDTSLLVPDLDRANAELRALLIDLHAHVETLPGDAARTFDAAIWRELRVSTDRRRLTLAVF
jgi:hypothetical protein